MARGINDVLLIGALARDPELRYTPSGTAVLNFTIAGDSRVIGSDGVERTLPWYQRGSLMGKQAENAAEHLKASDPVLLEGSLEYRAWETEQGQRRSKLEVKAQRLEAVRPQAGPEALITDATGGFRLTDAVNRVTVLGNLTRDVELRHTPNGFAVASLSLAVTESWKDDQGQWQERTHFVDVTLWRELAEAAGMLTKGTPVLVTGRLTNDSWTDKDGSKRSSVKVEADRLEPLSRPARPESQPAKPTAQSRRTNTSSTPNSGSTTARKAPPQAQAKNRKNAPPESEDMPF
jgi:single-strand DNA-binding protein